MHVPPERNPQKRSDSLADWPNSLHSHVMCPKASWPLDATLRRSCISSTTTEGYQTTTPLAGQHRRQATLFWLHSCYHRIAKQVATVCCSIILREKIHLGRLIKHEVTRCENICSIGHTKGSQVESKSVRKNDRSFSRQNANSSSNAKLEGEKLKLIGKIVKSKCGQQQRSTNKRVAPSIKPPTNSECRRTKLPLQYRIWKNKCINNIWKYRVGISTAKVHVEALMISVCWHEANLREEITVSLD